MAMAQPTMHLFEVSFNIDDQSQNIHENLNLLDFPLEIILKVCKFLDASDLKNIGMCCTYLRVIANEGFISRSKFYHIQQKIGVPLNLSLTSLLNSLDRRDIILTSGSLSYPSQFLLLNNTGKSLKHNELSKNLNRKSSIEDLERINVPKNENSNFVKEKIKSFQVELEITNQIPEFIRPLKHTPPKTPDLSETTKSPIPVCEITDGFTSVYQDFLKKVNNNTTTTSIFQSSLSKPSDGQIRTFSAVLNHINISKTNAKQMKDSTLFDNTGDNTNVKLRKQFFENLQNKQHSNDITVLNQNKKRNELGYRKPSKTVLKAVIEENNVSYEKMF